MERKVTDVKINPGTSSGTGPTRRYDASGRRAQAERSRSAIVEKARERFLAGGYAPTTVSAIAGDAGVSVETIYKAFGGKPGLVRAISVTALAGTGPVHAEQRSDLLTETEPDPREIIRGWGRLTTEVAPLAAPIHLLVRDAAVTDPAMSVLLAELDGSRLQRMTHNARRFGAAGHLRADLSVEDAGQIMWTYSSPELYELLVLRQGWSLSQLADFIAGALCAALLPSPGGPHS
jgi:AcrR family transcriptional regulator